MPKPSFGTFHLKQFGFMPIRIALVSYINTRPFIDGLEHHFQANEIALEVVPPIACARSLREGRADLALMPAGAIPQFEQVNLLPSYCIGADGEVASVFIFSQCPIEEIEVLYLDRHSQSSNGLARILMKYFWKKEVPLIQPSSPSFDQIKGKTGGVVIGDKAIKIRENFEFVYDLSSAWKMLTGLPFAFAVWAYQPGTLTAEQCQRIEQALHWGIQQRADSAARWAPAFGISPTFAHQYLTHYIDYRFDAAKHRALSLYLNKLTALPRIDSIPIHE